jgi:hypothetical protein
VSLSIVSKISRSRVSSVDNSSAEPTAKNMSRKGSMNAVMAAIRMGDRRRSSNSNGEDVAKSDPDLKSPTILISPLSSGKSPIGLSEDVIHEESEMHHSNSSIPSQSSQAPHSRRGSSLEHNTSPKRSNTIIEHGSISRRASARVSKIPMGFFSPEEDNVSAPDLSSSKSGSSPCTSNIATSSASEISPIKNVAEDEDDDEKHAAPKKHPSLAEILSDKNFGPQESSGTQVQTAELFKSGAVKLMESIPKLVQITVDRGFVMISEIDMFSDSDEAGAVIYRISHGACQAILSNRDKSLEIIHKNGRVRILAPSIEITMSIVCEINTATSKAAAQRGMSSTFDKPRVAEANIESYRSAIKSLGIDMPNLGDIVVMREIEYQNLPSPVGRVFSLSQTSLLARTSQGEMGKNQGYEIASKEEEAKYKITESHDDIAQKNEFLLSADSISKAPGVLMKHLSNSSLEMVVRYELNPDGTFTHAIGAATIEKLVERLADEEKTDTTFIDIFLHTFRHYTTVEAVLDMLTRRMNVKAPDDATADEFGFIDSWSSVIKLKYDFYCLIC